MQSRGCERPTQRPKPLQEEQAELLGAISGEGADLGLNYVGMEPSNAHNHLTAAELDQRDILYGSAFTPGGSSETHGGFRTFSHVCSFDGFSDWIKTIICLVWLLDAWCISHQAHGHMTAHYAQLL